MVKDKTHLVVRRPKVFDAEPLVAGFSTRRGGVSPQPFDSLNVGLGTDDEDVSVEANRERLFRSVGLDPRSVAVAGQVHGQEVRYVDEGGLYPGIDALVTDRAGLALAMTAADCAVVLISDSHCRIVGAAHSGWRGTAAGVVSGTIREMVDRGAQAERMSAYISPCISELRFEVGEEVAQQFPERFVIRRDEWVKPHVDLRGAIMEQLLHSGLDPSRIEASDECTYDHPDYYSYRADAGLTGRMMGFIAICGRH